MSDAGERGRRRRREAIEAVAVGLAAGLAGLTIMVPVDPELSVGAQSLDLVVFSVPRATMAAAFVTVLAAVFAVMTSVALAWAVTAVGAIGLLVDQLLWDSDFVTQATLNYTDSALAGMLMGIVGTLSWSRRTTATVFLFAAMSGIVVGDFTPAPDESPSALDEFLLDSPSVPLLLVLIVLAGLCAYWNRSRPASDRKLVDVIPLRPLLAAVLLFPVILLTSEWLARDGHRAHVLVISVVLIVVAAIAAALALPGRDGMQLLLMVGFAAAGSTPVTVPRPDWAVVLIVAAVGLGLAAGHRRPLPLAGSALTAGLAVLAIATALGNAHGQALAVAGATAISFVGGYCLAAAPPLFPSVPPTGIAVLYIPSAAVALWGRDFERVAYSPQWYRPTDPRHDATPGVVALCITVGCALGIVLLYRLRPATREAIRARWARMRPGPREFPVM
ncbi:hypothetical protein H0264_28540 [Nocardia huaxiensis]|uniref:Uncharacterized protein n=1 Tax=Nocardia huaxiensis TaxID=2755382 RepID=A0A7D6ZFP9_9NOCA|nr:hypothetical protein [Nocardia huaxiensis]QLY29207.1 hypothetical protein H0264_28540 [Nocardia huaxiensis]